MSGQPKKLVDGWKDGWITFTARFIPGVCGSSPSSESMVAYSLLTSDEEERCTH